jgi:chitinase
MKRRLFLQSGSATAVAAALTACGGGGGGAATSSGDVSSAPLATGVQTTPAAPAPAPVPETTTATAAAAPAAAEAASGLTAMPSKVLGCYYTAWDTGTYKITDVPTDFNVIYLFHCKPNGSAVNGSWNNVGDGSFMFEFGNDVTRDQVQACRARGQKVLLTVGGAGAGYAWDNRDKSTNFVNSFKALADGFGGVDGIDFNNYEAGIVTSDNFAAVSAEMVWISQQLKAAYGDNFAVTSPPQPNDTLQQALMAALKNAGVLTYCAPQFYDWSGFNAVGYIKNATDTWVSQIGAGNVAIGLAANYSNGPSLDDCAREWNAIKGAYPGIRGMFCWSAQTNMQGGNTWGSAMKGSL